MSRKLLIISLVIAGNFMELIFGEHCEKNFENSSCCCDDYENVARKLSCDVEKIKTSLDNSKKETKTKGLPIFDIRFDKYPNTCPNLGIPSNCAEATACTKRNGYHKIKIPTFSNDTFLVDCDARTDGGDWTVIQRRHDGSVDFYREWMDYKHGFGNIDGEFFIGLDKLHALTNYQGPQELLILMVNGSNSVEGFAKYDDFVIGNESEMYKLKRTGHYVGTAGESLKRHIGMKFSTKDQDNDVYAEGSCAVSYMGGWWYEKCHSSNLNGHYGDKSYGKGINWYSFTGHTSTLRFVKMMVRRRRG
uniref:Fibrinogen C-terminal domain-containing protein n=1 Tax=Stomoxys calcitrans TaxID=35570 RepID=A0A1I8Q2Y8_STOCA